MVVVLGSLLLVLVGIYAILTKKNVMKIVIGFALMEYAINLLFAMVGFKKGAVAPIITSIPPKHNFVDPLPQALVLTAIVIGLGTTAVMLAFALRIYDKTKTFDIDKLRRLKG